MCKNPEEKLLRMIKQSTSREMLKVSWNYYRLLKKQKAVSSIIEKALIEQERILFSNRSED